MMTQAVDVAEKITSNGPNAATLFNDHQRLAYRATQFSASLTPHAHILPFLRLLALRENI